MSDAFRIHVRKLLRANAANIAAEAAKIRELEAKGHRFVTGGEFHPDGWDIRDWRTNEIIASSSDSEESYEAVCARLDPNEMWWHIDNVYEEIEQTPVSKTEGVPESLARILADWVDGTATPVEDIAELTSSPP